MYNTVLFSAQAAGSFVLKALSAPVAVQLSYSSLEPARLLSLRPRVHYN